MRIDHAIVNRNHACRWLVAAALGCFSLIAAAQGQGAVGPYGPQNVFDYMHWQSAGYNTRVSTGAGSGAIPTNPNMSAWQRVNNYNAYTQSSNATGQTFGARAEVPIGNTGKKGAFTFTTKVLKPNILTGAGKVFAGYAAGGPAGAGAMAAFMAGSAFMEWMAAADVEKNPDGQDTQKPFLITEESSIPTDGYDYCASPSGSPNNCWAKARSATAACAAAKHPEASGSYVLVGSMCEGNLTYYTTGGPLQSALYMVITQSACPAGTIPKSDGTCGTEITKKPASWDEAKQYFTDKTLPSNITNELIAEAEKRRNAPNGITPFTIDVEPTTISNPPTIPPDKATTRTTSPTTLANGQPGTRESTATTTTTYPINVTGDRVTTKPVTTTTTRNVVRDGAGNVVTDETDTTTQEENPEGDDQDDTDTDEHPAKEDSDLCEKNPDILACAKPELDIPEGTIPKTTKNLTYTQEDGFGSGSCPADKYMTIHTGQQLKVWDWARSCQAIGSYFRPLLLAMAAFVAFIIVIPARTEV